MEAVKHIIWAVPGLCLFLVAWQGFNRPPTNRSSTTFALFYFGMLIYFSLLLAIWGLVFLFMPMSRVASIIGDPELSAFLFAIVAALVVVVASKFEQIKRLDVAARQFCIQLAAIPRLADQLGLELASRADFQIRSPRLKSQITQMIASNIGRDAVNFKNDGTPSSWFTRAVSLYWLFVAPYNNGTALEFPTSPTGQSQYARLMHLANKTVSQSNTHYERLMEIGLAYFTTARPLRQLEDTLRTVSQETSNFVCGLIARYVLFREKTQTQRRYRLASMGFQAYDDHGLGLDQWVTSILAIIIMTLIIIVLTPRAVPISGSDALLRSTIFAIQMGFSILAGTFVARRFLQRDDGTGFRYPPILELTVAGLIVMTISSVARIGIPLFPSFFNSNSLANSVNEFIERWSGVLYSFVNTFSIGLMCSYFTTRRWSRRQLIMVSAICNGVAFTWTAALVSYLLPDNVLRDFNNDLTMAQIEILLTSCLAGAAVGAMVLAMFKRNSRTTLTAVASEAPPVEYKDEIEGPLRGLWADRSLGGYSRESVQELEGRYVCFRPTFANPEVINAYLIIMRWDMKLSCLIFHEEGRADSAYIQHGQVYIPEGKPFINLVTMHKGDIRLITISRPDAQGLAQGLILTLSNPRGMHFTPASTPVVMRRLGEEIPNLGFVHPGAADYDLYKAQLLNVLPNYGVIGQPSATT
jgi:hypothetical protein